MSLNVINDSMFRRAAILWEEFSKSVKKTKPEDIDIIFPKANENNNPRGLLNFKCFKSYHAPANDKCLKTTEDNLLEELKDYSLEEVLEEPKELVVEERGAGIEERREECPKKEVWTTRIVPYEKKKRRRKRTNKPRKRRRSSLLKY